MLPYRWKAIILKIRLEIDKKILCFCDVAFGSIFWAIGECLGSLSILLVVDKLALIFGSIRRGQLTRTMHLAIKDVTHIFSAIVELNLTFSSVPMPPWHGYFGPGTLHCLKIGRSLKMIWLSLDPYESEC